MPCATCPCGPGQAVAPAEPSGASGALECVACAPGTFAHSSGCVAITAENLYTLRPTTCPTGLTLFKGLCLNPRGYQAASGAFSKVSTVNWTGEAAFESQALATAAPAFAGLCLGHRDGRFCHGLKNLYAALDSADDSALAKALSAAASDFDVLSASTVNAPKMIDEAAGVSGGGVVSGTLELWALEFGWDGKLLSKSRGLAGLLPCGGPEQPDFNAKRSIFRVCQASLSQAQNSSPSFFELYIRNETGISAVPIFQRRNLDSANGTASVRGGAGPRRFYMAEASLSAGQANGKFQIVTGFELNFVSSQGGLEVFALTDNELVSRSNSSDFKFTSRARYRSDNGTVFGLLVIGSLSFLGLGLAIGVVEFLAWQQQNPREHFSSDWCWRHLWELIRFGLKNAAGGLACLLMLFGAVVLVFGRLASPMLILLPLQGENFATWTWLVLILVLSFGGVAHFLHVIHLCGLDYFLIDWERKKVKVGGKEAVSSWRSILVSRKFIELSTRPNTVLLAALMGFPLAAKLLHLDSTANEVFLSESDYQLIFLAGIDTFALFLSFTVAKCVSGICELLLGSAEQDFLDLLPLANCSLFVLDGKIHGFYLHGASNSGPAECDETGLSNKLAREARGYFGLRGLDPTDREELQTFELFFPNKFRSLFEVHYKSQVRSEIDNKAIYGNHLKHVDDETEHLRNKNSKSAFLPVVPLNLDFEKVDSKKSLVVEYLRKILGAISSKKETYRPRSMIQKIFGMASLSSKQLKTKPVFFADSDRSFLNTTLSIFGFQSFFLCWAVLVLLHRSTQSAPMAALVAAVIPVGVHLVAKTFIRNNFSRNTLIHEALLT